jgi:hypothetical protein
MRCPSCKNEIDSETFTCTHCGPPSSQAGDSLAQTEAVPIESLLGGHGGPRHDQGISPHDALNYDYLSCPPLPPIWLRPGHPVRFGRGKDCDIILSGALVSRHHTVFTVDGGKVVVTDLGSTNGTFLNGERIESAVLSPGDEVVIGTWGFVFQRRLGKSTSRHLGADERPPSSAPSTQSDLDGPGNGNRKGNPHLFTETF